MTQFAWLRVREKPRRITDIVEHAFHHPVMQLRRDPQPGGAIRRRLAGNVVRDPALDAPHAVQPAIARDITCLARPRGQRTRARHHQKQRAFATLCNAARAVLQETVQFFLRGRIEWRIDLGEMQIPRLHGNQLRAHRAQSCQQSAEAKRRQRRRTIESQYCWFDSWSIAAHLLPGRFSEARILTYGRYSG